MKEYPVKKFIQLVQYDQSIVDLEKEKNTVEHDLVKIKHEFSILESSLKQLQNHVHELHKIVDIQEREMAFLDQQEREKKSKLDSVLNQREYDSVKREIDLLKKKQIDFEETLITSWKKFETAQQEMQGKKEAFQRRFAELDYSIAEKTKKIAELSEALSDFIKIREQKNDGIPAEWLDKYSAMRAKVSDPVVAIQQESCSACFYRISQKDLVELRTGKLITCRDCFRFLYDPAFHRNDEEGA